MGSKDDIEMLHCIALHTWSLFSALLAFSKGGGAILSGPSLLEYVIVLCR